MYSSSAMLKAQGRKSLAGKWSTAVIVCFIAQMIPIILNMIRLLATQKGVFIYLTLADFGVEDIGGMTLSTLVPGNTAAITWSVLMFLVSLAILPTLTMGVKSYFVALQRGENPSWQKAFSQFAYWWRNTKLNLITTLFIMLWSLLFLFPGIVAQFSYFFAGYLLIDHADMPVMESIRTSKRRMYGKKIPLVLLSLSFIGWQILIQFIGLSGSMIGQALSEVGYLFLMAYMNATFAAFYVENGQEKFRSSGDGWLEDEQNQVE